MGRFVDRDQSDLLAGATATAGFVSAPAAGGGMARMTAAAAEAYGFPANAAIVPVPGSEIAIRLLPRMARRQGGRHSGADLRFACGGLA